MDEIAFQSAVYLTNAIQDKIISSSELLELYIKRYDHLNPRINAIVDTDFENATRRAKQADEAVSKGVKWGPLHGLPMTIKDHIEVTGLHSTWGSPLLKDYVPTRNADAVQSLLDAGAIVFGKTNMPLWGNDHQSFNEIYGQTNNPWDLARTPGGSSGGAAAALAAGLTGLEFGSDIGGSIRNPAHFCGVYGHKPTFGIVPQYGLSPGDTIDYQLEGDMGVAGPLARSAEDLDLVMGLVVRSARPQRKVVKIELPAPRKDSLKDYQIGVWFDDGAYPPDRDVGDCLQEMADSLSKSGAKITRKKPDIDFKRCFGVFANLLFLATADKIPPDEFDRLLQTSETFGENDQSNNALIARAIDKSHRDWLQLNAERATMRQKWADYFKDFDVLLCPTARIPAFPHDHSDIGKRLYRCNNQHLPHPEVVSSWAGLATVAYLPATVAPIGLTKSGLPVGVQIVGPYLEDRTPIHFAKLMAEFLGGFSSPPGYE